MAAGESASMDFSSSVAAGGSVVCVCTVNVKKIKYDYGVVMYGLKS